MDTIRTPERDEIHGTVREHYARISETAGAASCAPGCCGANPDASTALGYSPEELAALPEGANLGLGCGNPQALASLRPGEVVLDLGSGGGIDCFLAARKVGPQGRAIGVDMTPEMLVRARAAAKRLGIANVEFRLGEIEHLPVADGSVDVILSNCVINLSPDKPQVFREALRVLKPGGRLAIADVVALRDIPPHLASQVATWSGCVAGAAGVRDIERWLLAAGFTGIRVQVKHESRAVIAGWFPGSGAEDHVASATIEAVKPAPCGCAPGTCG